MSAKKNLIFATEESQIFLYNITQKTLQGPLDLLGKPKCMRTFDAIPDFIFLGIEQMSISNPGSFGQAPGAQHTIQIVKGNMGNLIQYNAHNDAITDIEYTVFNG